MEGRKRILYRTVTTALTVAMMFLIFSFSTEPAEKSDRTSWFVSRKIIRVLYPDIRKKTGEERIAIYNTVQHTVRKAAHFTEYMILGLLIRLCLESWFGTRRWSIPGAWLIGTLYAGTDELHQLLIDGRSGQWSDVLLDSAGVLTGVMIAAAVILAVYRKRQETEYGVLPEQPAE